jgi:hypothetical protein
MGQAIARSLVSQGVLEEIEKETLKELAAIRNKRREIRKPWAAYAIAAWMCIPLGFFIGAGFKLRESAIAVEPKAVAKVKAIEKAAARPLKMKLEISSPDDLKVKLGEVVTIGQILADRSFERNRLDLQKSSLLSSITKLTIANNPPLEPKLAPQIDKLPEISFSEEEANINNADIRISDSKEKLRLQERKVDTIATLPPDSVPSSVAVHEQQVLVRLEKELEKAKGDKELTIAKLQKAKDVRAYDEYRYSVDRAKNAHEQNQAFTNYDRAKSEFQKSEQERNVELANLQQKINEVDNQLANLALVRSPYNGKIKRLKFTGQNNNSLTVELLLAIDSDRPEIGGRLPRGQGAGNGATLTSQDTKQPKPISQTKPDY